MSHFRIPIMCVLAVATPSTATRLPVASSTDALSTRQQAQLAPPPSPEEEKKVLAVIKDTYKTEYQLKEPAQRTVFAKELIKEGVEVKSDPATRYVMLLEARNVASAAGDLETAYRAVDELSKSFTVDSLMLKVGAVEAMSRAVRLPNTPKTLADQYIRLAEEGAATDRFNDASSLLKKALTFTGDPSAAPMSAAVNEKQKELADLRKEFGKAEEALKALRANPDDQAANLVAGRYWCFRRNNWDIGLPYLAKCSDTAIRDVVAKDLQLPKECEAQASLADEWRTLAEKARDRADKQASANRALYWCRLAAATATGLTRSRLHKKIVELYDMDPALKARQVDLLSMVQLTSGTRWERQGNTLISPPGVFQFLGFPYVPPEEYDLTAIVQQTGEAQRFYLVVALIAERHAEVNVDTRGNEICSLGLGARFTWSPGTQPVGDMFKNQMPCKIVCQVRRSRLLVAVNDKVVIDWTVDLAEARNGGGISIGTSSVCQFHKVLLTPVTGQGKRTK